MNDTQKLLRIYSSDMGIRVMTLMALVGLVLALRQRGVYTIGLLALGWGLYLLEEHLIHRFIFHAPAPKNQFLFDLLYRLHYGHHDQQRSKHLLFTPLWFALPIALVTVAALSLHAAAGGRTHRGARRQRLRIPLLRVAAPDQPFQDGRRAGSGATSRGATPSITTSTITTGSRSARVVSSSTARSARIPRSTASCRTCSRAGSIATIRGWRRVASGSGWIRA